MSVDPVIAITMGDPAGIGPEVTAKALAQEAVWDCCRPLVVGDAGVLAKAAALVGGSLAFQPISQVSQARFDRSTPDVLDLHNGDFALLRPGRVSAAGGRASV
ncbi:MAG: 4-hydroxythreonine-4-phosphate dehydrogenase PdxA, partial [Anaerolineales bacterium]